MELLEKQFHVTLCTLPTPEECQTTLTALSKFWRNMPEVVQCSKKLLQSPKLPAFLWEQAWKQPQCGHVGLAPILSHSCEEQLSWGFFVTPTWWCFKANVSTSWVRRRSWWGGPGSLSMNYCLMGISNHIYTIAWNSSSIPQSEILNIYHGYIDLFICHLAMDFRELGIHV